MNTASQQQQPKPKEQHRMAKKPKIDHDAAKSNPKWVYMNIWMSINST